MEKLNRYCTCAIALVCCLAFAGTATAQLSNDTCATATVLPCGSNTLIGETTDGGVDDYDGASCTGYASDGPDVVYEFTLSQPMYVTVIADATAEAGYTGWDNALYVVTDCSDILNTCVAASDTTVNGYEGGTTVDPVPAGTYFVIIDGYGTDDYGDFDFYLSCEEPPAEGACCVNGICTDAVAQLDCTGAWFGGELCADVTCPPANDSCDYKEVVGAGTHAYDLTLATTDGLELPVCDPDFSGDNIIHNDVWFNHTATCDGTLVVQTCDDDTALDTKLAVYEGCTCPDSDEFILACDDDTCGLETLVYTEAILGNCYKIQVGTYSETTTVGPGMLTIECLPVECGNGYLEDVEECDDGNTIDGDGCQADCTLPDICGDGYLNEATEECDDGNTVDGDGCQADCTIPVECGDGYLNEALEECDDGNTIDDDGCDADCTISCFCGDGVVNDDVACGEECDDGNDVAGDGCENDCTFTPGPANDLCDDAIETTCGTTIVGDNSFAQDDVDLSCNYNGGVGEIWYKVVPNATSMWVDTNSSTSGTDSVLAVFEGTCGGLVEIECDDDGGDGYLSELAVYNLTPGDTYYIALASYSEYSRGEFVVSVVCPVPECGNGIEEGDEQCDDGNTIEGDGCENDCTLTPDCGDGTISGDEECDDGNQTDGDGCASDCTVEDVANDDCVGKPQIYDGLTWYTLVGKTDSLPAQVYYGTSSSTTFYQDIWYNYTATCDGHVSIDNCFGADDFDTKLAVYDGCDCPVTGDYALMYDDDDCPEPNSAASAGEFPAVLGNCYKVRLGTYSATTTPGTGAITITCFEGFCGDGYLDGDEECDDGNTIDGDGCDADCTLPCECGDGVLNDLPSCGEVCDDGNTVDGDGCEAACDELTPGPANDNCLIYKEPVVDGSYLVDLEFATEDGPQDGWSSSLCGSWSGDAMYNDVWFNYTASCDGTLVATTCDPDSTLDTKLALYDGCVCPDTLDNLLACDDDDADDLFTDCGTTLHSTVYAPAVLGNCYKIQAGTYSDTSAAELVLTISCLPIECGNGFLEGTEECDDGNTVDGDGCDSDCTIPCECGDGFLNDLPGCGELCDDGNTIDGDGCDAACVEEFCGDGVINDTTETCDDGNTVDGDGCDGSCYEEVCGNGILQVGEDCDDGNTVDGDGCSAICEFEPGGSCGDPIMVGALPYADTNTTCGRVDTQEDTCLGYYDGGEDIFYEFTLAADQCVTIEMVTDTTYTGMVLDDECPATDGDCIAYVTNSGAGGVSFAGLDLSAGTYYLMLDTWPSPDCIPSFDLTIEPCPTEGACCVDAVCTDDVLEANCTGTWFIGEECAEIVCPPANDDCEDKQFVVEGTYAFSTISATQDWFDGDHSTLDAEIWYNYYAGATGAAMIHTCGSFDTVMEIYDGCDCPPTTAAELAFNDDNGPACSGTSASIQLDVTIGNCYKIRLGGYNSGEGEGVLTIDEFIPDICGNGYLEGDEVCDDGNLIDDDGCDADCTLSCVCGDGVLNDSVECGEECDDGNLTPGDGCDASCVIEILQGDTCADPLPITVEAASLPYTAAGSTVGMFDDYADTCLDYYDGGEDVIYELTVSADICVNINMTNATVDYLGMAVHDTCPIDGTTCLFENTCSYGCTDLSLTNVNLEAATGTYYLMIDNWAEGEMDFDLEIEQCPSDGACCTGGVCTIADEPTCVGGGGTWLGAGTDCTGDPCALGVSCAAPIVMTLPYEELAGTTCGFGDDYTDTCETYDNDEDKIFELTVSDNLCIDFTLEAATSGAYPLVIIDDDCSDGFNPCLYNEWSSTTHTDRFEFPAAGTYYIMIDSDNGSDCMDYDFTVTPCPTIGACCVDGVCTDDVEATSCTGSHFPGEACVDVEPCPPANDDCEGAIEMFDGSNAFDTTGGTDSALTMCDTNLQEEVWYTYTATCDGDITFGTCYNPGEDTVLEVFQGADCASMVTAGCSDDDCGDNGYQSTVTVTAVTGDVFFIAVSGYNGGVVVGDLSIEGCDVPPTGACCEGPGVCTEDVLEADCTFDWYEGQTCDEACPGGLYCDDHLDCVAANNNCCEWDECDLATNTCKPVVPNMFGDVCGSDFPLPPNGAVNLTDVLCTLNAFGLGNLANCPNADVVIVADTDCPAGNGVVNLTDILKVLDAFGAPTSPSATFFCDCPENP